MLITQITAADSPANRRKVIAAAFTDLIADQAACHSAYGRSYDIGVVATTLLRLLLRLRLMTRLIPCYFVTT